MMYTGTFSFHPSHSEDSGRTEVEGAGDDDEVCDPGENAPIAIDHDDTDDGNFVPCGSNSDRDKGHTSSSSLWFLNVSVAPGFTLLPFIQMS